VGTAWRQAGTIDWVNAALVLAGALLAHICVNAFNEYFDLRSGLDARTTRTPFSGGSGTLPARPELGRPTLLLSCAALVAAAGIGTYFIFQRGWMLAPLVAAGLVLLVTYTLWWVYNPLACLLAPGIGFGVLMVMGTHFSLTGTYTLGAFVASLVPTFYLAIITGVAFGLLPVACLLALLTVFLAVPAWVGARRHAEDIPALVPSMGLNVIVTVATPAFLAAGLFIG